MTDRPTPTKVWKETHKRLLGQLKLPCKLGCSNEFRVGGHKYTERGCRIVVNPTVAFKVPEHLILHEAAHHIIISGEYCQCGEKFAVVIGSHVFGDIHHCEHWAKTLLDIYRKTGTPLPFGTQFELFAKVAGIHLTTQEGAIRSS